MLLSKILDTLTYGELSQLAIGGLTTGGIQSNDYPQMLSAINMAMLEIYKRFDIKSSELTLQLSNDISVYNLTTDHAESNTAATGEQYILDGDTVEKFTDNILLITHVYQENGDELALNDLDRDDSVYTPTDTTIQVPYPDDENILAIIYRAIPDDIDVEGMAHPDSVVVNLPYQYLAALTAYTAYRIFSGMPNGEGFVDAKNQLTLFEGACNLLEHKGVIMKEQNANTKFEDGGWV